MNQYYYSNNELTHFGILGMKWGVRRYQNPDGSLTEAGKKRYGDPSRNKENQKELKKQIKKKRAKLHGSMNRWANLPIGQYSKKAIDESNKNLSRVKSSKAYKQYVDKLQRLDSKWDEMDPDEWDEKWRKVQEDFFKTDEGKLLEQNSLYTVSGKVKTDELLNGYGRSLTIGYLRDLGYDKVGAEYITDTLAKDRLILWG